MTLVRIVIPHRLFFEHDLGANADRICPEGKPVSTFPDHAPGPNGLQKGSPAKTTGRTLCIAPHYSQKTPKNNGLFGTWLAHFGYAGHLIALFGGRIDPPQDLVEMGLDRLIAAAGPAS